MPPGVSVVASLPEPEGEGTEFPPFGEENVRTVAIRLGSVIPRYGHYSLAPGPGCMPPC